jgi:hypothetical protein
VQPAVRPDKEHIQANHSVLVIENYDSQKSHPQEHKARHFGHSPKGFPQEIAQDQLIEHQKHNA